MRTWMSVIKWRVSEPGGDGGGAGGGGVGGVGGGGGSGENIQHSVVCRLLLVVLQELG